MLKFIYSEKATKFCEISTVYLSYVVTVKYTVEISQNFVAFSEYMNFTEQLRSRFMLAKIWLTLTLKIQRHNKVFFPFSFRNFAGSIKMLLPLHFMKVKKNFGKCQS